MSYDFLSAPAPLLPSRTGNAAPNPFAPQAAPTSSIPEIDSSTRASYDQMFHNLVGVPNGTLAGAQARPFFAKSGLPNLVLAQIWGLADMNKDGSLDREEFAIAFHLCQAVRKGATLPTNLPRYLVPASKLMYYQNVATNESEWVKVGASETQNGFSTTFNASTTSNSYHTANQQQMFNPTTPQQNPPAHSLQPTPVRMPQQTSQQNIYNVQQPLTAQHPSQSLPNQAMYGANTSSQNLFANPAPPTTNLYNSSSGSNLNNMYTSSSGSNLNNLYSPQTQQPSYTPSPQMNSNIFPANPPPPLQPQSQQQPYGSLFSPSQPSAQQKVDLFSAPPPTNNFFDPPKQRPQSSTDFSAQQQQQLRQQQQSASQALPRATSHNDFFSPAPPPPISHNDFFSPQPAASASVPAVHTPFSPPQQPIQRQASTVANPFGPPSSNDFFSPAAPAPAPPSDFFSSPPPQSVQPQAQRMSQPQDFFSQQNQNQGNYNTQHTQPQGNYNTQQQQSFSSQQSFNSQQQSFSQQRSSHDFFASPAQPAQQQQQNAYAQKQADPFASDPFAAPARAPAKPAAQQGGGGFGGNPFGPPSNDPFAASGASTGSSGLVFIPPEHQVKTREMDASSNAYAFGPGVSFEQRIALSSDLAGAMKKVREKNNMQ